MGIRTAAFVYHDSLASVTIEEDHPLKPIRLLRAYKLLEAYGAFDAEISSVVRPLSATRAELVTYHTPEYVDAVESLSSGLVGISPALVGLSGQGETPGFPGMHEASLLSTGGRDPGQSAGLSGPRAELGTH